MGNLALLESSLDSDEGYQTLLTIRKIFYGKISSSKEIPSQIVARLLEHEVIECGGSTLRLTDTGYVLGNICKEYCNWIDNNRRMPSPKPPVEFYRAKTVLDLGCSFGRWLWEFEAAERLVGVELEKAYVGAAKVLSKKESKKPISIINASVEELEDFVEAGTIDFVFSRLVFNHVWIDRTLKQAFECLAEGGRLWLQVENRVFPFKILREEKRLKGRIRALFTIFNTVWFQLTGRQIVLRFKGRMHSEHKSVYPHEMTWKKHLIEVGFTDIQIEQHSSGYVFTAVRGSSI